LPIATKLKNWGAVVFVAKQPRKLQAHEIHLLTSMANQIGIPVENGKEYSQTVAKAKELAALYSIARDARVTVLTRAAQQSYNNSAHFLSSNPYPSRP
jgi:GAF domain-containing protein